MAETPCSRCGSEEVIPDVEIVDHGYMDSKHALGIELHGSPGALIFKDTHKWVLHATVYCQCGKVELSIDNPRELWEIYRRQAPPVQG